MCHSRWPWILELKATLLGVKIDTSLKSLSLPCNKKEFWAQLDIHLILLICGIRIAIQATYQSPVVRQHSRHFSSGQEVFFMGLGKAFQQYSNHSRQPKWAMCKALEFIVTLVATSRYTHNHILILSIHNVRICMPLSPLSVPSNLRLSMGHRFPFVLDLVPKFYSTLEGNCLNFAVHIRSLEGKSNQVGSTEILELIWWLQKWVSSTNLRCCAAWRVLDANPMVHYPYCEGENQVPCLGWRNEVKVEQHS